MTTLQKEGEGYARLNCRVSSAIKRRAEEAAELLGQSITAFTESALTEKAEEVLSRLGRIQLSDRDFQLFARAINNPPRPTEKMRKAASGYKKLRARTPQENW